jgi:hypothetical protein
MISIVAYLARFCWIVSGSFLLDIPVYPYKIYSYKILGPSHCWRFFFHFYVNGFAPIWWPKCCDGHSNIDGSPLFGKSSCHFPMRRKKSRTMTLSKGRTTQDPVQNAPKCIWNLGMHTATSQVDWNGFPWCSTGFPHIVYLVGCNIVTFWGQPPTSAPHFSGGRHVLGSAMIKFCELFVELSLLGPVGNVPSFTWTSIWNFDTVNDIIQLPF